MADPKEYGLSNHDNFTTNDKPDSVHESTVDIAKAHIIFDGTKNNIFNTKAGQQGKGLKGEESYVNAATSVALMWDGIQKKKIQNPVYIDGIGTTRLQKDNQKGYAFGKGETGIDVRARSAFAELDKVLRVNRGSKLPALLNVNVYGFSRGAATARHFVHLVNDKSKQLYPSGWDKMQLRINFVGLFDTVSSYAPGTIFDLDFDNDVEELHLNFGANYAQKVFHLIAGDEYRENFSVTTIASAGEIGHEIVIPGAHSDVGGSYNVTEEEQRYFSDDRLRQFVHEQGWYTEQDCIYQGSPAHRRMVLGEYSKVGHSIMVDAANAHLGETVFADPEAAIDPDVIELQTKLRAFAKDKKNTRWDLNKEMPDKAKAIRHKLFHVSFNESAIGLGARRGPNGRPMRKFIAG